MKHNMREEIKRAGVRESALSRYAFRLLWSLFRTVLLVAMSFVILYPLLYMISMAIRQSSDVYDPTVVWVPRHFTLENFRNAAEAMKYGQALMNTLQIAIFSSVIQMLVCSFVAYGFARFRFPLKKLFILCLFLMVVIPTQTISLPTYTLFRNLDFLGILQGVSGGKAALSILDTPFVFYLPAVFGAGLRSGIFILIFMQFFRNMPKDLEDAAYIDGCGFFKTYVRIMLPNLRNAMLIVFLFSFVWYCNDYYLTTIFAPNMPTLSTMLANMRQNLTRTMGTNWDTYQIITMQQAGALLTVAPLLLVYMALRRFFAESVERSGIVG